MKKYNLLFCFLCILCSISFAQKNIDYPKSNASYSDFKSLVSQVENHRKKRLINLDQFLEMSTDQKVLILDTRSKYRYDRKHLKGAIHMDFTDFTQKALQKLIPDPNTTILIYCNNNFVGDPFNFPTKSYDPDENFSTKVAIETQILSNKKPILLALNIPTYINLYGYNYKNVFELNELVNINDSRIVFEGSLVKN